MSSIKNWKKLGKQDPYYGVLSDERFRLRNITEGDLKEFFLSGEQYVNDSEIRIKKNFGQSLADSSILDFGCGVGRLVIPFAQISEKNVVGVDVSADILEIAKAHKSKMKIPNLELLAYDGISLPKLPLFDFINSYIVFQHIESSVGFSLLNQLLEKLKPGGILQVQLTYGHDLPKLTYLNFLFRGKIPIYNFFYSLIKNKKIGAEAIMQMNHYSPKKLFGLFSKYSRSVQVEFTNHGGHLGAFYLLKKDI